MKTKEIEKALFDEMKINQVYDRNALFNIAKAHVQTLPMSTIRWTIYSLIKQSRIQRIGRNKYIKSSLLEGKKEFTYQLGEYASILENDIRKEYPKMCFTIYETSILNEFVNHMRAKNIIFINVENDYTNTIFEHIQNTDSANVYLKPKIEYLQLYLKNDMVIVNSIGSEYPKNRSNPTHSSIESFVVDIFRNKIIKYMFSEHEISDILKEISGTYLIDEDKMLRYARRRNVAEKINKIMLTKVESNGE
jgi:hypothetical protein